MSYLKIDNNKILEAPYKIERDGFIIYGYNKENNEAMLFQDGYKKYPYDISHYEIKNDEIVEKIIPPPEPKSIFTKLQIRRAMRQLGIEDKLNDILANNFQFYSDWNDAQEIDLNDSMMQTAIQEGYITQEIINAIREIIQ